MFLLQRFVQVIFSDRSVSIEIGFNYSKVEHFRLLFKLTSNLDTSVNFGVLNK